MPSAIVHLYVANRLSDYLEIKNLPQFYLGAISPDAVNLNGFADEKTRYGAHIRSKNPEVWKENVRNFHKEKLPEYSFDTDFFNGFEIHLLTDIAWDEAVQPRLFDGLKRLGTSEELLRREKWNELYRFNSLLMSYPLWDEIKGELSKAKPVSISTVSAELLGKFLAQLLDENYSKAISEPPLVLTLSDIDAAVSEVKKLWDKTTA